MTDQSSERNSKPVVITRPEKQAHALKVRLDAFGIANSVLPMFDIGPLPQASDYAVLDAALRRIDELSLVIFVSPNAIDAWFERLAYLGITRPLHLGLAGMGAASRIALIEHGVDPQITPLIFPRNPNKTDSETLLDELDLAPLAGREVLIVRGDSGRDFLADRLRAAGVQVNQAAAYQRIAPPFDAAMQGRLQTAIDADSAWVVTSSELLPRLLEWCRRLGGEALVAKMQQQLLFVPHIRIFEKAKELGFQQLIQTASGDENLALAIQSHYERTN
ncbi:uroporphyrinogen-III synthase [Undibacterium cyanobacteriorum]|uniref:Uroporphyrinogen-III synthase n=1 Tax=Undibacterium cyanobacteriorum TaxID=3073561 RepID=A0ABY9RFA3_9BURK|nr:uroporphyrinogen-III synthase [Undibacterium sp. 20NA77.5]WMW79528.1 uroporphyrinogen-III synthase [Undibacterium sp. 20NA77.5]